MAACVIDPFLKAPGDESGPWICLCLFNEHAATVYGTWDEKRRAVIESYCGCQHTHIVTNRANHELIAQEKQQELANMMQHREWDLDAEYAELADTWAEKLRPNHGHVWDRPFGIKTEWGENVSDAQTWDDFVNYFGEDDPIVQRLKRGMSGQDAYSDAEGRLSKSKQAFYKRAQATYQSLEEMQKSADEAHRAFAERMRMFDNVQNDMYEYYIDNMGRKKRRKKAN